MLTAYNTLLSDKNKDLYSNPNTNLKRIKSDASCYTNKELQRTKSEYREIIKEFYLANRRRKSVSCPDQHDVIILNQVDSIPSWNNPQDIIQKKNKELYSPHPNNINQVKTELN